MPVLFDIINFFFFFGFNLQQIINIKIIYLTIIEYLIFNLIHSIKIKTLNNNMLIKWFFNATEYIRTKTIICTFVRKYNPRA